MKQKERPKRKKKLKFEPGKVFDVKPAHDLDVLDAQEMKTLRAYKARKGQGGDRGPPRAPPKGFPGLETIRLWKAARVKK